MRWFSIFFLKMSGWRTEGKLPSFPKFVLVAAPHTSNWDLPYALFVIFVLRAKIYWLGKDAVFRMPFKRFFTWIGGLPVDRTQSSDTVSQLIKMFHENERLMSRNGKQDFIMPLWGQMFPWYWAFSIIDEGLAASVL